LHKFTKAIFLLSNYIEEKNFGIEDIKKLNKKKK